MKNRILLFSLVLTLLLGCVEQISACSCATTTPCQSFNYAEAVFVGKVVGAKQQRTVEDYSEASQNSNTATPSAPKTKTYDVGEIYLEVEEAFHGVKKGERVTIHSGTGGGDCGYWFSRGETYVVYASAFEDTENKTTGFSTSICSGTRPLEGAANDLEYLRNFSSESRGKFYGGVRQKFNFEKDDEAKPYADLTLNFHKLGSDDIFSTTTDSEGEFNIDVPAGKYKIVPLLPEYARLYETGSDPTEVEVKPDACRRVYLSVESKSEISGKLISFDGKPLEGIQVELIDFATDEWAGDGETDADGAFSIPSVPAGKYILAVNKNISPHKKSPFPAYFYPKSFGAKGAETFTVKSGESVTDLLFQLPPPLKEQIITGKVVRANGKPAADARVELEDSNNEDYYFRGERVTQTDASGKFVLAGFSGRTYTLKAVFEKFEDITEEEAKKEMEQSRRIAQLPGNDDSPRYARVTRGEAKLKPFKVANKPFTFKIVLKEE